jgi:hypothetical protein
LSDWSKVKKNNILINLIGVYDANVTNANNASSEVEHLQQHSKAEGLSLPLLAAAENLEKNNFVEFFLRSHYISVETFF